MTLPEVWEIIFEIHRFCCGGVDTCLDGAVGGVVTKLVNETMETCFVMRMEVKKPDGNTVRQLIWNKSSQNV